MIYTTRRQFLQSGLACGSLGALAAFGVDALFGPQANAADKPVAESAKPFGGMIAVLVTPYQKNGAVDGAQMETLSAHMAGSGVDGIFVSGSTGDMPLLEWPDREILFRSARNGAGRALKIYGGVTSFSVAGTIENCKRAADLGVDAAVVMTPLFFFRYSPAEVTAYMKQIADGSPIPVVMYHHRKAPTPIELESIDALAGYPNILGMKETGSEIERTFEIQKRTKGRNFIVLQGNEGFGPQSIANGADGMMGAMIGVVPEIYAALWEANRRKDQATFDKMTRINETLCAVFALMPREGSFSYFGYTLKRMLMYRGWQESAFSRLPGFVPDPEYDKALIEYLDKIQFPKLKGNPYEISLSDAS